MNHVLFVCTGNTCRSPMAEAILKKKLEQQNLNIEVRSAGVAAMAGSPASLGALEALRQRQIMGDMHRSQIFTNELGQWADLILTMTSSHKKWVAHHFPQFMDKVFTLKEYSGGFPDHDLSDPFGGNQGVYEKSAQEIERAINLLVEKLKQG